MLGNPIPQQKPVSQLATDVNKRPISQQLGQAAVNFEVKWADLSKDEAEKLRPESIRTCCSSGVFAQILDKKYEEGRTPILRFADDNLRVLTYNVWFELKNWNNRLQAIAAIIRDSNAHVVCLQECTLKFFKFLEEAGFRKDYPYWGFQRLASTKSYGCAILCKVPPVRILKYNYGARTMLPDLKALTKQGRAFLVAELFVQKGDAIVPIYVGTSHFESRDSAEANKNRAGQSHDVFGRILEGVPRCVVVGDYNQDSMALYQKTIKAYGFKDAVRDFAEVEDFSFSMPTNTRFPQWRPDKMCLPQKGSLQMVDCQRVGWFCIPPFDQIKTTMGLKAGNPFDIKKDGAVRTPSDHTGLIADFNFE